MSATPLAQPSDVEDLWRPLTTDAETTMVANLIRKASAKLRQACPFDIDERIAQFQAGIDVPSALDPDTVADVVATIVKRFLVNPQGTASDSEAAGPFSHSQMWVNRYDKTGSDVRGAIQVIESDIAQLRPAVPASVASSFRYRIPKPRLLIPGDRTATGRPAVVHDRWPDYGAQ